MHPEPPFDASKGRGADGDSAFAEQLGQVVHAVRSAFSSNTERAVRSDLVIYAGWCAERGEQALPASAGTLAAFLEAMAETRSPATVRRYVASIGMAKAPRSSQGRHGAAGAGIAPHTPAGQRFTRRLSGAIMCDSGTPGPPFGGARPGRQNGGKAFSVHVL